MFWTRDKPMNNHLQMKEVKNMLWAALLALFDDDLLEYLDEHPFELGMFCASIWDDD